MQNAALNLKRLIMVLGDYGVFAIALAATLLLRYGAITPEIWQAHAVPFSILGVLWSVTFYINGLYDLTLTRDTITFLRLFLESMTLNLAIAFGLFYLITDFGIAPRTNLILDFVMTLLLGYAWRLFFHRTIARSLFRNRVAFVGRADQALHIKELLKHNPLGFELVGVMQTESGLTVDHGSLLWQSDLSKLAELIRQHGIQTVVLGHRPDEVPGLKEALYATLFTPVALVDYASLEESVTGRVPLEHVTQTWFLEHLRESDKTWYESSKRLVDILLAIPFGLLTIVLYPFIALIIRISSPGPILYSQTRIGKYGKPFEIYKFRTMHTNSEQNGPQFTADAKTDPRLFQAGRILRQLRIDEFPQIWNVLTGDLSFVGPRPERPEFVQQLAQMVSFYPLRHLTRPGLTGWAQTRYLTPVASLEGNLTKLQYDLYYIKHRSPLLDCAILLKTIGIVLRRQGT